MTALTKKLKFDDEVLSTLEHDVVWVEEGGGVKAWMPQLDPNLYQRVKKAFKALGGEWNRRLDGTIFETDPRPRIQNLIDTGALEVARDGFFVTPPAVVAKMLEYIPLGGGEYNTLEPSCGTGAILRELIQAGLSPERLYGIEQNQARCEIVRRRYPGVNVICADFTRWPNAPRIPFARIFMNPPFEQFQDGLHIRTAYQHLDRGGMMAAVTGESIHFRKDPPAAAFRAWLKAVGAHVERLPDGSFLESGTGVSARLVIVEKD